MIINKCCTKPNIKTMEYKWHFFDDAQVVNVNRVCLKCGTHWFGVEPDVKQYTSKEWDALIERALNDT